MLAPTYTKNAAVQEDELVSRAVCSRVMTSGEVLTHWYWLIASVWPTCNALLNFVVIYIQDGQMSDNHRWTC